MNEHLQSSEVRHAIRDLWDTLTAPFGVAPPAAREATEHLLEAYHALTNGLPLTLAALAFSKAVRADERANSYGGEDAFSEEAREDKSFVLVYNAVREQIVKRGEF